MDLACMVQLGRRPAGSRCTLHARMTCTPPAPAFCGLRSQLWRADMCWCGCMQVLQETFQQHWAGMSEVEQAAARRCILELFARTCADNASPADLGFASKLNDIVVAVHAAPL
jgi:hypothetical protein